MAIDWNQAVIGPLTKVFGEACAYTMGNGTSFPITAVFDEAYLGVSVAGGVEVTTEIPVLGVQLSQFPTGYRADEAQGDTVTINRTGETFVVKEGRPDGHGHAKLMLTFKLGS